MPKISVAVPRPAHVDVATVKEKTALMQQKLESLHVQDFQLQWTDSTATFHGRSYGFAIQGVLDVQPERILIEVDLPWAAALLKDRVRQAIEGGVTQALGQRCNNEV